MAGYSRTSEINQSGHADENASEQAERDAKRRGGAAAPPYNNQSLKKGGSV